MDNSSFWNNINKIIADGFNCEGISKLDNYAKQFRAGKLVYRRFAPTEQSGFNAGGPTHVIASILSGAEIGADKLTAPKGSFKREQQRATAQAEIIERWAKTVNCWYAEANDVLSKQFGEPIAEGGEAVVYDNGSTVIKAIRLDYYVLPELALDRITLHNTLFEETKLEVIGFGKEHSGDFVIITSQPFIKGNRMSNEEIHDFVVNKMCYKMMDAKSWTYATNSIYLSDLHDENVICDEDGNVFILDCDVRINVPELKMGGIRHYSHEVWGV